MRPIQRPDKYNIAWFKLAEFVSRGEKERALGIYKLLALSFDDEAFKSQLEGDILQSFDDRLSIEKYKKAAELYQLSNRFIEAAAIYEYLLTLDPSTEIIDELIQVYKSLNKQDKIKVSFRKLFKQLLEKNKINLAKEILIKIEKQIGYAAELHELTIFYYLNNKTTANNDELLLNIKKIINEYSQENKSQKLMNFLTKLENINKEIHTNVIEHLKK